ncbi:hypothetical protein Tco_1174482 [Tanacetum coccineum]
MGASWSSGGKRQSIGDPVTLCTTPLATQGLSTDSCFISHGDYTYFYRLSHSELVDIEKAANIRVISFTMKMEILLELTSNVLLVERFDTSAGNPVKEILLKLNLPDNMSILTDLKVTPTNHWRMIKPYSSPRFIANCFNAGYLKIEVKNFSYTDTYVPSLKRQSVKVKEIQERCIIKAFQDYQIKKGMSMSGQKSQVHEMAKFTRWRNEIMLG